MASDSIVTFEELEGESELMPPEMYAANLVEWALDRHASDLFVSDDERSVVISVRRLGRVEIVRRLAREYGHRLQGHLRVIAGSDAGEMIRPTEGRGVLNTPNGGNVDLRLSSMPTLFGQDVAVRLFDPARGARGMDNLGIDATDLAKLESLLDRPSGLILVAGPVASGKSSTLYAAIDHLNDGTRKIHTLEDPVEHAISGVMQSQVNLRAGLDFAELLSTVLRHSPDVIMIGEIRDAKTASTAVRAGASGQLVLATIHAKTSAEAIDVMLQHGTNPKFLSGALVGIISQRLIRRLCPDCRQPIKIAGDLPIPSAIQDLISDQEVTLYDAVGCDACFGDGFQSLSCLPEIMVIDESIAESIACGVSAADIQIRAIKDGMLTLPQAAMMRVLSGHTTAREANRVVADPQLAALAARVRDHSASP